MYTPCKHYKMASRIRLISRLPYLITYLLLFNRLRFCLSLNRRCDTLDLISTVVSDSCINVESGPPLSIWCTRLTNIRLPGLHCFVFPSPSLLSLSSPSSKFSAAAGISHGTTAPASPHQVVRAASKSFLASPWAVMRSACTVLDEPTRRSHGLRSSPNAHSIEPAHDPCSSSSSL